MQKLGVFCPESEAVLARFTQGNGIFLAAGGQPILFTFLPIG